MDSEQWTVISGQWTVDSGQWTVDSEQWTVDSEQWTVISGQWTVDSDQKMPGASQPPGHLFVGGGYSDQTASTLPWPSEKWKRLPPGKSKVGTTMEPPAAMIASCVALRSWE